MKKDIFQLVDECVLTKRMNEVSKQIEEYSLFKEYDKKRKKRRKEIFDNIVMFVSMFMIVSVIAFIYLKLGGK